MSPGNTVIWVFLVIFVLTALIALASLPGWLRIEQYYKRKLFQLLILQVVACIIGFGTQALRQPIDPPAADLRSLLLEPELGWDWQYVENGWRARLRFERDAEQALRLVGETYLVDRGTGRRVTVIEWESVEPFEVASGARDVTFRAYRTWTQAAAEENPDLRWEVGKKAEVQVTLRLDRSLRGAVTDRGSTPWAVIMTPGFPR